MTAITTPSSIKSVVVADINSPATEMADLEGRYEGNILTVYEGNEYTFYSWTAATLAAAAPYIVAGSTGYWVAVGGKFTTMSPISSTAPFSSMSSAGGTVNITVTNAPFETIALTASAPTSVMNFLGASSGVTKVLMFDDANFTLLNDSTTPKIILQGNVDASFSTGDIVMIVNRGGVLGGTPGYWREIWRSLYS